jgi:multiple sugar transport system permease protein
MPASPADISNGTPRLGPGAERVRAARPRRSLWERSLGYGLALPAIVALVFVILVPLGWSLVLSLYSWSLTDIDHHKPYVGLANFRHALRDSEVRTAARNTLELVVGAVTVELVLGFAVALALYHVTRGRRLANAIVLLPMIITPVIVALIWRYLLDPQFGIVNYMAGRSGLTDGQTPWLGSERLALPAIGLIDVWQWTPFVILILHAGMLAIPSELTEAARVDGASAWRIVRHIFLPALRPLILLVLLFRTMDVYRLFDTVYVLTQGGPGLSSETLGMHTYRTGFIFFDMGYAMALSILMLIVIVGVSAFYLRLLRAEQR